MITIVETREEALRRLLQVARDSGVRLLRDDAGEMWATSVSDPDWLHKVEPDSCGCRGFARAGRCRHVAALQSHLGYFDPEPEPPAMSTCGECGGLGEIQDMEVRQFGRFAMQWATCPTCDGAGKRAMPAVADREVA
jgi:hypothetical protein